MGIRLFYCVVLCCVVLCGVVLYCVVLCCVVLCYAMLCCVVLCCFVLCCVVLCYAVLCCAVLCCVVLCCVVLCCVPLYSVVIGEVCLISSTYNLLLRVKWYNRVIEEKLYGHQPTFYRRCQGFIIARCGRRRFVNTDPVPTRSATRDS